VSGVFARKGPRYIFLSSVLTQPAQVDKLPASLGIGRTGAAIPKQVVKQNNDIFWMSHITQPEFIFKF